MQKGLADLSDSSESDLTEKQMRFVHEFLLDLNATQAAIRAGYSEKGASVAGSRLLANAKVKKVLDDVRMAHARSTFVDTEYVIRELVFLYDRAWQAGKWTVAKGCLDLMGRHAGTYVDRQVVMQTLNLDAMSHRELQDAQEQLEEQYIEMLRSDSKLAERLKTILEQVESATSKIAVGTEGEEAAGEATEFNEHRTTSYSKRIDR